MKRSHAIAFIFVWFVFGCGKPFDLSSSSNLNNTQKVSSGKAPVAVTQTYYKPILETKKDLAPVQAAQTYFTPLIKVPFTLDFTPQFEVACGPSKPPAWNHSCNKAGKLSLCQPLGTSCTKFGQRLLTKTEAAERIKWAQKCFASEYTFNWLIPFFQLAAANRNAMSDPCPLYPAFGFNAETPTFWEAPVDSKASCNIPTNVFPVMFCTSHL